MAARAASTDKSSKGASLPKFRREAHGVTDVGLVREGNEDALVVLEDQALYVVADGMGGHSAGEVASAFTIEAIRAFYQSADLTNRVRSAHRRALKAWKEGEGGPRPDASFHALRLHKAVESANISVYRLAQQHEQLRDMGTTCVAVAVVGAKAYVANVGDSRVYMVRKGKLIRLTEDHSLLNEYLKMNLLQPEEVETFPYKNVIVRALGLQESVAVDITETTLRVGDELLLCSDGLTDLVRDDEIRATMVEAPTSEAACYRLIAFAKSRGGHDNITTLVIRLHDPKKPVPKPAMPPPPGPPPSGPPPASDAPVAFAPPPPGSAPVR
jgi:protein phosphatase